MVTYSKHQHDENEQAFDMRATLVVIGEFAPTNNLLDKLELLVGTKPVAKALELFWKHYPWVKRLKMPFPALTDGHDFLKRPQAYVDIQGVQQRLCDFRNGIEYCDQSVLGEDLNEIGEFLQTHRDNPQPGQAQEYKQLLRKFAKRHEPLATLFAPTCTLEDFVQTQEPIVELLTQRQSLGELVQAAGQKLHTNQAQFELDGQAIAAEVEPHAEALGSLAAAYAYGSLSQVYGINCADINQVLATGRTELLQLLAAIPGAQHIDVLFLNRVNNIQHVRLLASELDKKLRCAVYATIGGLVNEKHATDFANANPVVAAEGPGNVHLTCGTCTYQGLPAVPAAAVVGNRWEMDGLFSDELYGPMEAMFGPRSCMNLLVEDVSTANWTPETCKFLAETAGLNVLLKHGNGVISPFMSRSQSSLQGYQAFDGSRFVSMITAAVMAYLDVTAPACRNVPRKQRLLCETARDLFLTPYLDCEGFSCTITPQTRSKKTRFVLSIAAALADVIEEIVVVRKVKKIVKN